MDNKNYYFGSTSMEALEISRNLAIAVGLPFIPKKFFFISLFVVPDTPLFNHFVSIGITEKQIHEKMISLINEPLTIGNNPISSLTFGEDDAFSLEDDIFKVFDCAKDISERNYARDNIEVMDLISGLSEVFPDSFLEIMHTFIPNYGTPTLLNGDYQKHEKFIIPSNLSNFLSNLNENYSPDEKECRICGREKETMQLIRILMKKTKRNAVLIGEPGVGKTALLEKFAWMIVTGNCPKQFQNSIILVLDVNAIVAGTKYRGTAEERFMDLISFLENHPNCILFVDEIHLLLGAGACKDGELDLANALKPLLARGDTQVIGATTTNEYLEYFSKDSALKRRFEKIIINEPRASEIYPMIKNQIKKLEEAHHTSISKELVDFVILNASCFNFETKNPDRTLDLLDKAMVCAELEERDKVTKQDILENFSLNKEKFEKMSPLVKESTAYHEAGHYIVYKFAEELSEYNILAVSIIPAEDYLGVNVFEIDPDVTPTNNITYYTQLLGSFLAGRIAEKMYSHSLTAGASSDLEKATRIAKDVITRYGLDEEFTQDRVFLRESKNPMYNDELITKINLQVDKLLKTAREYVEKLLKEKRGYLDILAKSLMENGMLSKSEIDNLFEKYEEGLS